MPVYRFKCECGHKEKKLLDYTKAKEPRSCPTCSKLLERDYSDTNNTTLVKETIDNGLQNKKVEQFAGSPEMIIERDKQQQIKKNKDSL